MKKTHLINIALVIGSVLFSAGLAEAYLRLAKPYWLIAKLPAPPNINVEFETDEFKTRVITNNIGLRDHREFTPDHRGTYRIAAIGDSFPYGWGVNNNEAFPAVLENILKAKTDKNLEIINFSRPGDNPLGYLRTFVGHTKRLKPDMVIMSIHPANDCPLTSSLVGGTDEQARQRSAVLIQQSRKPEKTPSFYVAWLVKTRISRPIRAWFRNLGQEKSSNGIEMIDPIDGSRNPLEPHALKKTIAGNPEQTVRYQTLKDAGWVAKGERREISPWLIVSAITNPDIARHALLLDPKTRPAMEHQWDICQQAIKSISKTIEATEAKFVLMVLATPAQVSREFLAARRLLGMNIPDIALTDTSVNDRLKTFCEKEHLICIDTLLPARQAAKSGTKLFYPIDGHPTAKGQALYAKVVAEKLVRLNAMQKP